MNLNTGASRQLRTTAVRIAAHQLVGPCNDYQIMFCASAAGITNGMAVSLEELADDQFELLEDWIMGDYTDPPSEWDIYKRYV